MIYRAPVDIPPPAASAARDPRVDPVPGDVISQAVGSVLLFRRVRKINSKIRGVSWWSDNPRKICAEWTIYGWRRWAADATVVEVGTPPAPVALAIEDL